MSVHEATIALAEYQAIEAWATGTPQKRWGFNRFTPTYPMGVYRCKQGWIGITIVTPAQWKSFCDLMGMPELGRHPAACHGRRSGWRTPTRWRRASCRASSTARPKNGSPLGLELRLPFAIVPDMKQVLELAGVPRPQGDRADQDRRPDRRGAGLAVPSDAHAGQFRRDACRSWASTTAADLRRVEAFGRRRPSLAQDDRRGRSKACASSTCRWAGPVRSARATSPISAPT